MARQKLPETELGAKLAEALHEVPAFRAWLLRRIEAVLPEWAAGQLNLMYVRDDHPEPSLDSRRTDIWAAFTDTSANPICTHLLLGELKILAPFGRGQAEDYRKRVNNACGKLCRCAAALLMAPERYLGCMGREGDCFPVKVSLEDMKAFFDHPPADLSDAVVDKYVEYRWLLGLALEDEAVGYMPLDSELRETQFRWYRMFVMEYQPHLVVHDLPGRKQSYDIQFDLPVKGFGYIKHRLIRGKVVIEWLGKGDLVSEVTKLAEETSGGRLVVSFSDFGEPGKSLHIRFRDAITPPLALGRGFAEQAKAVRACVDAVNDLWQWVDDHAIQINQLVSESSTRKQSRDAV